MTESIVCGVGGALFFVHKRHHHLRRRRQVASLTTLCYIINTIITTRGGRACYHNHSWVLLAFTQASGEALFIRRNGMPRQRLRIEGVWYDSSDVAARRDGQAAQVESQGQVFLLGQPAAPRSALCWPAGSQSLFHISLPLCRYSSCSAAFSAKDKLW